MPIAIKSEESGIYSICVKVDEGERKVIASRIKVEDPSNEIKVNINSEYVSQIENPEAKLIFELYNRKNILAAKGVCPIFNFFEILTREENSRKFVFDEIQLKYL